MNARRSTRGLTKPLIRATIEATILVASEFDIDLSDWNQYEDVMERRRIDGIYRRAINWSQRSQSKAYSRAVLHPRTPWRIEVELMLWYGEIRINQWIDYNPLTGRASLMQPPPK